MIVHTELPMILFMVLHLHLLFLNWVDVPSAPLPLPLCRTPQLFTMQRWDGDSNTWRSVKLRITATGVEELGEAGAGG
jgi:hypothetical protein